MAKKTHILVNEHLNAAVVKRGKEQAAKNRQVEEKQRTRASIETMCDEMGTLVRDSRYKGYNFLLTARMDAIVSKRDNLRNTTKTNDEYLRQALVCDAEIAMLKSILSMQKDFSIQLKMLQDQEKSREVK